MAWAKGPSRHFLVLTSLHKAPLQSLREARLLPSCIQFGAWLVEPRLPVLPLAKSLQSGLFCNPMDCSPPGSSVPGILQARIQKWVAISSSRGSSRPGDRTRVSYLLHWQAGSLLVAPCGKPVLPLLPPLCQFSWGTTLTFPVVTLPVSPRQPSQTTPGLLVGPSPDVRPVQRDYLPCSPGVSGPTFPHAPAPSEQGLSPASARPLTSDPAGPFFLLQMLYFIPDFSPTCLALFSILLCSSPLLCPQGRWFPGLSFPPPTRTLSCLSAQLFKQEPVVWVSSTPGLQVGR